MKKIFLLFLSVVFLNLAFAQSLPSYVPASGLVGWWPFSGNANDISGHSVHGTVHGAILTADRHGTMASAYFFNGLSDYIITSNSGVTDVKRISVSAWIKITGDAGNYPHDSYFQFGLHGSHSFACGYDYSHKKVGAWSMKSGSLYANHDLVDNWHHMVVIDDSSKRYLYIDGVKTDTFVFAGSNTYQGSNVLVFGAAYSTGNEYFTGAVDDIGLWNRVLTPAEVWDLYMGTTTAIEETYLSENKIFPNPSSGQLQLKGRPFVLQSYRVFNVMGQQVLSGTFTGNTELNMEQQPPGLYIVEIGTNYKQIISLIK